MGCRSAGFTRRRSRLANGVALQQVARVDDHHLAGVSPCGASPPRWPPARARPVGAVREVVPVRGPAVRVGSGDHHEMGPVRHRGGGQNDRGEEGKHRPEIYEIAPGLAHAGPLDYSPRRIYVTADMHARSRHRPSAHRRGAHSASHPQLPRSRAALRLRPPGGARSPPAHRVAPPPGAAPGRPGAGHADRAVRALSSAPRPRRPGPAALRHPRRRGARRRRACGPSAIGPPTGAGRTPRPVRVERRSSRHDAPHSRGRRRAGHHRAGRLPPRQGRLPGLDREQRPGRAQGRARGAARHRHSRPDASRRVGLRRPGRAAEARRDQGRRRHPAHGPARGDRPHPRPLARRRRLPHQAVLAPGALAPGARPAPAPGARRR